MMSLQQIRQVSREAAVKAARQRRIPYVITAEDKTDRSHVMLPFLGDYVPKGWLRTERDELFVDSTGVGGPNEPAMTSAQMFDQFTVGLGYAIVEAGQFQVYVAEYIRK
jgi:hypothetical protein